VSTTSTRNKVAKREKKTLYQESLEQTARWTASCIEGRRLGEVKKDHLKAYLGMHNIKFNSQAHWDDLLAAVEKHIYSGDDMSSGDEATTMEEKEKKHTTTAPAALPSTFAKLTVAELKNLCRHANVQVSDRKAELIQRLQASSTSVLGKRTRQVDESQQQASSSSSDALWPTSSMDQAHQHTPKMKCPKPAITHHLPLLFNDNDDTCSASTAASLS